MSNKLRVTSLYSGLDTQSIVEQLVSKQKQKINKAMKNKSKIEYQTNAWKEINSDIYSFYSKTLFDSRLSNSYSKMKSTSSSSALSVSTNEKSHLGTQTVNILSMAKTGYVTSAKLDDKINNTSNVIETFGLEKGNYKFNGYNIDIDETTTISDLTNQLNNCGVKVNFDEKQHRFYISANKSGTENDFSLSNDKTSSEMLNVLGLNNTFYLGQDGEYYLDTNFNTKVTNEEDLKNIENGNSAIKIDASNAKIKINGTIYESNSNTFSINNMDFTINSYTNENITVTTSKDSSNVKNVAKGIVEEYNKIMENLLKRYNTGNNYEPLTDEEKDVMTDREIEKWEEKLEEGCLYKDSKLNHIIQSLRSVMANGIEMSNGETMYLSDFGIDSYSYFASEKNQRNSYNIDDDKLINAINGNEELASEFFSSLSKKIYDTIGKEMGSTQYSSIYKIYDDKLLSEKYEKHNDEITKLEEQLTKLEDKYYSQFSAMEVALSKMQSNMNSMNSFFNF